MIQKPRGTIDITPKESYKWRFIETQMRNVSDLFGFSEIRTPTFEAVELYQRGVGGTTDIVQKEMFTFSDREEDSSFALRPEGTAGVMRSVIENSLYGDALPLKLFYLMNCFRYEKPQAGRSREFFQYGIEQMGTSSPAADAEVIAVAHTLFRNCGAGDGMSLHINSIGCPKCRPAYHAELKKYLSGHYDEICETCKVRFEKNPLRILDCKSPVCGAIVQAAPKSVDHLCPECFDHFESLKTILTAMNIPFTVDTQIVRGLDYYTKTVFEFISDKIGAQSTVCGGGRYDGLSESVGGPALPGIGFGLGITRLLAHMEACGCDFGSPAKPMVYIAALGGGAVQAKAMELVTGLRYAGIPAQADVVGRSLKSQMKYADKTGARFTYIIGSDELEKVLQCSRI